MAVLKDLIVHGTSRFLNGINADSIETNAIKADSGIFNQLIATTLEAKDAHIDELTANNATVFGIMDVKGKLQTNQWEAASIANIGGNFYISPTGKSSSGTVTITRTSAATSTVAAKYSVTMSGTFGVSSTSNTIWAAGAYGMATGNVAVGTKKYPLGTCDGPLSNITTGTNTITGFTISNIESAALDIIFDENSSLISSNAISGQSGSDLQVSVYLGKSGNNYMPIGILLTSYGKDDKQYIDIYDGNNSSGTSITGFAEPVVRIGDLSGLNPYAQSGGKYTITPQGWGIYTSQGYFRGEVYSEIGYIGGWTIDGTSIKTNNKASISDNTSGMRIDSANGIGFSGVTYFNTNGTGKIGPWTLTATALYNSKSSYNASVSGGGVYIGTDYIAGGNGEVWWLKKDGSAKIGAMTLSAAGVLSVPAAYITGTLTASQVDVSGIISAGGIVTNTLTGGTFNTTDYIRVSTQASSSLTIGTSGAKTDWRIIAGKTFGVDKAGNLYATSANITGEITATALKIGSTDYLNDIQDISNKASSTDLTTEINQRKAKYGTQSATSTDATSQVKAITCSNFELVAGNEITVYFKYANTYASGAVQLNVNSKGAKNIWVANAVTSTTNKLLWGKDAYITFRYNGSAFIVIGEPRIWYGACSTSASANAKTDTTAVTGCVICKGTIVNLAMTNENTGTAPTLNIQSTGALTLYAGTGTTRPLASNGLSWSANTSQDFVFDGVQWRTADSGSAARSKALSDAAAKTATNCITEISNAGIWVTPSGKKPDDNGDAVVDSTTGTLINADGVGIYKDGNCVAQYGSTTTIGQTNTSHIKLDSNSMILYKSAESDTNSAYFKIKNGATESGQVVDTFSGDGTTNQSFILNYTASNTSYTVTQNGTTVTVTDKTTTGFKLTTSIGDIVTVTYNVSGNTAIGYDLGIRKSNTITGEYSIVEGYNTTASGERSHAEGSNTIASGRCSHAEGFYTTASGNYSHSEGIYTTANGEYSHAEGYSAKAGGHHSHSEGHMTEAIGDYSHAEGYITTASRESSHAEGYYTIASGYASHAEGYITTASGGQSHAEGYKSLASGNYSHAEGYNTTASGFYSHAQNYYTISQGAYQTAIGKFNIAQGSNNIANTDYAFIIGNGTSDDARSNALTVDWNGTITANGYICNNIGGNSSTTHASILSTWFANHKSSISRNTVLSYWSSSYGNGSQYIGYFLNGYDTSPYGGFFVCHYTTPWYVGVSNGNFIQYELTRTATSSRKTKENIKSMTEKEAKKLYDLDVISFDYKKGYEEGKKNQFGLIAEDCDKIIPYVVCKPDNNEDSIWGIDYTKFVPYLIKNLQLHEKIIEKLNDTVQQLMDRVDKLESEIKALKSQ